MFFICKKRYNALQNELVTSETKQLEYKLKLQQQQEINLSNVNALNQLKISEAQRTNDYLTLKERYDEQREKLQKCAQDNEKFEQLLAENKRLKKELQEETALKLKSFDDERKLRNQINIQADNDERNKELYLDKMKQIEAYSGVVVRALELLKTRRPGRVAKNNQAAIKLLTDFKANV
jgi:DNA primase catalytic subunit